MSADGTAYEYTEWNQDLGSPSELTKTFCGENRYVGVENFLEFYITPGCEIRITPRDAIFINVRLDWTLEEFYADDGLTNFEDRMAAILGVDSSQIKIVSIYEGTRRMLQGNQGQGLGVTIDYFVEAKKDSENP